MKKIIACFIIVFIHLMAIFILCYMPFVQMNQIDTWEQIGSCKDDKILNYKTRLQLYPHCWFIHKGDTYTDIPLFDNDNAQYKADIKFNWDNSVTIRINKLKYDLHIEKIEVSSKTLPMSDYDYRMKLHDTDDSLFVSVVMYDKSNTIRVYRQKKKMPYGGKRVGFIIGINNKVYFTGPKDKERFHY